MDDAKFLARGDGYALFLTPSETVLALGKHSGGSSAALRLKMIGAHAPLSFVPSEELPGKSNYILGNSPGNWRTNVPNYRKVAERGIYDGIDIIYYGNQRELEYDFVVAPGSRPDAIQIAFEGDKNLHIDPDGDLVVSVAGGDVRLHRPVAYQGTGDLKREIPTRYVMKSSHSVSFLLARYDADQQLIIDPVLSYSTYLGGSNIDGGNAIAVAPDNSAFVAGGTFSTDFPTAHPLQPNVGGPNDFPQDAFVAKISADGSTLLYSTYLGGKNEDVASGIAVDSSGNAYVTGTTLSPDFPVTPGSFNPECGGDAKCGASFNPGGLIVSNGFVTKLNPAGSGIIYSGFLGGYENTRGQTIAVDQDEFAYVTGQTEANLVATPPLIAPPFPITPGAFQPTFGNGSTDAYVTKISPSGNSIVYSSYLGGADEDVGNAIAVDNAGKVAVGGLTYSANFPLTAGAAQGANGGAGDAFISEINTRASGAASLVYSTYLGGSGLDQANGVALDANGNIYVAGGTASSGLFASAAGFAKTNNGQGDAFVVKLNPAVSGAAGIVYFTYLGGSKADSAAGVAVDPLGNAYVTGSTVSSSDFPIGPAAFQPAYGGGNADSFVTELNPAGTTLIYSSYLGGTNTEIAGGIGVDASGSAYVTGQTCSQDFPATNPLQAAPHGNCDGYISKVTIQHGIAVNPAGLVFPAQDLGTTSASQTLMITNGDGPVTITSIVKSGLQAGDFTVGNAANCTTSLLPGSQCAITVTFTPSASGIRKALITINAKDALNNPLPSPVLNLTGGASTGTLSDFTLSTVQASATVSAGQSATYQLTISPVAGFSQPVAFSCSGLPRGATCSVSPNPTTPQGGSQTSVIVTVNTAVRAGGPPQPLKFNLPGRAHNLGILSAYLVLLLSLITLASLRRRPATVVFGLTVVLLLLATACSSGGSSSGVPAGTPAGTSQFTVTATSGSLVHTDTLTLNVN